MKLIQLISSKINTPKLLSILMIAVAMGMSSCNVKEVLTDANGQKKSFILFNPNFLLTNYQVRLVDSLNNFITEDLRIDVLSNKKIVNDEGYYTTSFTTSNGVLNFSVDPNENISASDSIEFAVFVSSDNKKIFPAMIKYKGSSKFDRVFKLIIKKVPANLALSSAKTSLSTSNSGNKMSLGRYSNLIKERISFDGVDIDVKSTSPFIYNPNLKTGYKAWVIDIWDPYGIDENNLTFDFFNTAINDYINENRDRWELIYYHYDQLKKYIFDLLINKLKEKFNQES